MSDPIILPSEVKTVVDERLEIWADIGRTKSVANDVMSLSSKVPAGNAGSPVGQLIDTSNPPAEIAAVLSGLRSEVQKITRYDTDIENTKNTIIQLQKQRTTMIVFGVIGSILVVFFLIAQIF